MIAIADSQGKPPGLRFLWFLLLWAISMVYNKRKLQYITLGQRWDRSVGRALHRHRRGHGFESRSSLNFFRLSFHNCLSCALTARIFLLFDLSSAVQNISVSYINIHLSSCAVKRDGIECCVLLDSVSSNCYTSVLNLENPRGEI